jgi:membrane protein implicated in regulation of membrane protease activity
MSPFGIFFTLAEWNWLIAAAILMTLELLAPGFFLLFFGIAAGIVGIIALTIDMSWQYQLVLFGAVALVCVMLARKFFVVDGVASDKPLLNKRVAQHIGKSYILAEDIKNGRGKVLAGDTVWQVQGPELTKGERVKVTGVNGVVLVVEAESAS